MTDQTDSTIPLRPQPKKPATGMLAWQATVGHMSSYHSPDALLKIHIDPGTDNNTVRWSALVSWAMHEERALDRPTLADALRDLWLDVLRHHVIFDNPLAAAKSPEGYPDEEWLDIPTEDVLLRLIWMIRGVFGGDWALVLVYQPVENANTRVQVRLMARNATVHVGGRGPSIQDACHDLFRNAGPLFIEAGQDQ